MVYLFMVGLLYVQLGVEGVVVDIGFGMLVDDVVFFVGEGVVIYFIFKEILVQFWLDGFEYEVEVFDQWIVV